MFKLFVSIAFLTLTLTGNSQIIFQSDFSSWTDGVPNEFLGPQSTFTAIEIVPVPLGAEHGTLMANMLNTNTEDKLFTTIPISVVGGESYKIQMWTLGLYGAEMRTGFYDSSNEEFTTYNPFLDIGAETGEEINLVTQIITVPSSCTSGEFVFSIRNTSTSVGIIFDSLAIETIDASNLIEEEQNSFSIYPVPSSDFIQINSATEGVVSIFTVSGQLVLKKEDSSLPIDISELEQGLYIVRLENENGIVSKTITVN